MTVTHVAHDLFRLLADVRLPPQAECEFVRVQSKSRSVGWADGASDVEGLARVTACAVRVLINGGQALVKIPEINKENVAEAVSRAILIAQNTPQDPHRCLAKPQPVTGAPAINDPDIFTQPVAALRDELRALEALALQSSPKLKKVVRFLLQEETDETTIVNTHGLNLTRTSSNTAFMVEVLAEEAGETEVAWEALSCRFGSDLNKEEVVKEAAQTAVLSLGGKPAASGVYPVVLHPVVGTQLLSLLAQAFSAEAVQNNRSFLKGLMNEAVAAPLLTVMDDPTLLRGAASVPFDDEGMPSVALPMIEQGVLKNYFFDLRSSKKAGGESNGRGFRSALAAPPSPHATNLFVAPGRHSTAELLSSEKTVFLLHDIMGLHMAEPVTGEFSLGVSGFLYENGRFSRPVRGMTLAGTVGGLLKNTAAVGNIIHWRSALGAPYMLVRGMTLSGN